MITDSLGPDPWPLVMRSSLAASPGIEVFEAHCDDAESAFDWLRAHVRDLHEAIDRGGILLRGFTCLDDADDFERVLALLAPEQLDYVGGTSPRTVVQGRIMTATDLPPRYSIPLHQEMAYIATPPERIAFFCDKPASRAGQTTITDMRAALGHMPRDFIDACRTRGVQLRRKLPSAARLDRKPGIPKSWTETFGTDDRDEAVRIVAARGWSASWRDDDTLEVAQDLLAPTRSHPVTGEESWANFAHFFSPVCQMTWALEDGRVDDYEALATARRESPEVLDQMTFGDGEPLPEQACLDVYSALRRVEVPLELGHGDMVVLDNLHYAHGRRPYEGPRRVLVSIFNRVA